MGVLGFLLAVGVAGGWAWYKVASVPPEICAKLSILEALKFKDTLITNPPKEGEIAAQRPAALMLKEKLAAEFPALRVTARPVPDDENGFLLLHQLADPGHAVASGWPVSEEFRQILEQRPPWDPAGARQCLTENAGLVSRIEHIADLTTRSSSNLPAEYNGLIEARTGKNGCDILLLKARLAAEAGDENETLRLVHAAVNLGSHYHAVESPTLLCEIVAILTHLSIDRAAFQTLLPAVGRKADLVRWKAVLGQRSYTPADLAGVMRGEWNTSAEFMFFPFILAGAAKHQLPDAEAVARAGTSWFNTCVTRLDTCALADVATAFQAPTDVSHLSPEGREVIADLTKEFGWAKGYVRAATVHAQHQAALELLILEQGGATLTDTDAARITPDPVSGLPFGFDAAKRVLTPAPDIEDLGVKPLALPW